MELSRRGITVEEATPAKGEPDWGARLGELLGSWQKVTGHREAEDDVTLRARYKLKGFQSDHAAQRDGPLRKGGK